MFEAELQTFPHRDIQGADESAKELISTELKKLVRSFHAASDVAFQAGDYKNHAIAAMAANKISVLCRALKTG